LFEPIQRIKELDHLSQSFSHHILTVSGYKEGNEIFGSNGAGYLAGRMTACSIGNGEDTSTAVESMLLKRYGKGIFIVLAHRPAGGKGAIAESHSLLW
jgi:hypothetical protein